MKKIIISLFVVILIGLGVFLSTKASAKCIVGGCSGELCVSEASDGISNCMYKEAYGCYKVYGECGQQLDGKCGWKQTTELLDCLKDPTIATKKLQEMQDKGHN
ncbi:MAG: hypothetical protein ACK5BE_01880 [Alphaproteobacteria bacterium]|jgi:eight-cysteine-cluster-containing protein